MDQRERDRHRRGRALLAAGAAALMLVGAACGSSGRGTDEGAAGGTDTSAVEAETSFGTLPSPCGPGDATGATDQGVTDTAITIGYGDDAGYQGSPGLFHEMSDAMEAMIGWCNELGGINGRPVEGIYYDAKLTEVNNVMTEACSQVFMLVGQGWSLDSAQEQVRRGCGLPSVPGYTASPEFANAPLMIQPVPNPADYTPASNAAAFQQLFPEQIKKSAVVYGNFRSTIDAKDKVLQAYPEFGFEFLPCPQEYPIAGTVDWRGIAQALSDCGAEVVYFVGAPYPTFENFLDAAGQAGYDPLYVLDPNFYDETFAAWNTSGLADNVYVRQAFVPMFEANASSGTQQYLDLLKASGGDVSQAGQQSASAFLLWATAVKECGSDVTRACVMEKLAAIDEWTGGGMHAPTDPASNLPPDCGALIKLEGTTYVRVTPEGEGEFTCDPAFVVAVGGEVVERARLDANRVSQLG